MRASVQVAVVAGVAELAALVSIDPNLRQGAGIWNGEMPHQHR